MKALRLGLSALMLTLATTVIAQPNGKANGHAKHNKTNKVKVDNSRDDSRTNRNTASGRSRYYYYPSSNVYYNPVTNQYAYAGSNGWMWNSGLPSGVNVSKQPRQVVYYDGNTVWSNNAVHVKRYSGKPKRSN